MPLVERAEVVVAVAPVFREEPLMRAVWENARKGRGRVYLVGSSRAVVDEGSYFLALAGVSANLYTLDPWPLKVEGSFVVVDGRRGVIGPLVAGLADPEGKTRWMKEEEVKEWWRYGLTLLKVAKPLRYDPVEEYLRRALRRLGVLR